MALPDKSPDQEEAHRAGDSARSGVRHAAARQPVVLVVEATPALVDVVRCAISAVDHTIRLGGCSVEAVEPSIVASRPFLVVVEAAVYAADAGHLQALALQQGALLAHVALEEDVDELEDRLISMVTEGFARYRHDLL